MPRVARAPARFAPQAFNAMGHLGQEHYVLALEIGRRSVLGILGNGEAYPFVLAHMAIDYRAEILPDAGGGADATVETAVSEVGARKVVLAHALKLADSSVAAEAVSVLVAFDVDQRVSRTLSAAECFHLEGLLG